MLILRKFGKILRGKATPFQIVAGCLLGAVIGFMPGFSHAPGLIVVLSFALIVLNTNLFIATMVGLGARLLALVMLPVTFSVGRLLLDGPTEGIFRQLINAPVFALFGFESYVATGGLALGTILGLIVGLLVARGLQSFRRKMASLDETAPRFHELAQTKWARWATFVFAGGGLKKPDYAVLLKGSKIGNPVRPLGIILVLVSIAFGVIACQFFASSIVTAQLRSALERVNGATVDLDSAELDLKSGRMELSGIAVADPNALGTDLFRASRIEADVSGVSLLRKRLQLDRVVIAGASTGEPRRVPGRRLSSAAVPSKPIQWPDAKGLEEYMKNAQVWRERLAQLKQWIGKIAGPAAPAAGSPEESLAARLQRQAAEQGYVNVVASQLIEGAPSLLVTEILAAQVKVAKLQGESLDITMRNLSTQPGLTGAVPEVSVVSASDRLGFNARFGGVSSAQDANTISFHYRGVPVDSIMQNLKVSGGTVFEGGTIDLAAEGNYMIPDGSIDLPLQATLRDTTLSVGGRSTKLTSFVLPIGLTGSLSNPKIKVDSKSLGTLALKAGTEVLKDKASEKLKESLGEKAGDFFKKLAP